MIELLAFALLAQGTSSGGSLPPFRRWWESPPPEAVHRSRYDCQGRRVEAALLQAHSPALLELKVAGKPVARGALAEANKVLKRDFGWLDSWQLSCDGELVPLYLNGPNREKFPPEYRPRSILLTFLKGKLVSSSSTLD